MLTFKKWEQYKSGERGAMNESGSQGERDE